MVDDEAPSFIRTHIGSTLLLVVIGLFVLTLLAGVAFSADPVGYAEFLASFLTIRGGTITELTPEAEQKLIEAGLDPAIIAAGIESQNWISSAFDIPIDLGIYQAINEYEWDNGKNPGAWHGLYRACKYSAQECEAAKWLLNHMKEHGVVHPYLTPDYSDYRGAGAGEFGPGLLPSTAKRICEMLQAHPDPTVRSCNFFDPTEGASAGVFIWLKAIGYRGDQADPVKFQKLYGWNHLISYRWDLINRANDINDEILVSINLEATSYEVLLASPDWWKQPIIALLRLTTFWPDSLNYYADEDVPIEAAPGDELFAMIYPKGTYVVIGGVHGQSYDHCAIDVNAYKGAGTPVFSPINGVVTQKYVQPKLKNTVIRIENSMYVVELLHGNWNKVRRGQRVSILEQVGTEASIGNSTGPHTHFHAQRRGGYPCVNPEKLVNWPPPKVRKK